VMASVNAVIIAMNETVVNIRETSYSFDYTIFSKLLSFDIDLDKHTCLPSQFKCPSNGTIAAHCIIATSRCDGLPDCPGREDELNCRKFFNHNNNIF